MNSQLNRFQNIPDRAQFVGAAIVAGQESPDLQLNIVLFISRILFAVFIVGLMGYFFDRTVQSLKLRRIKTYKGVVS